MNEEGTAIDQRLLALLMEAAEWRLLARLFECPAAEWQADLCQLAGEVSDRDLRAASDLALRESPAPAQYHSLFGPGGPAPPREASYRDSVELGSLMSELAVYYDAFGYAPAANEPPDHVAVETGFIAYLKLKEAYALANDDRERAALTASASARFHADHLASLAAPLARILENAPLGYLARAARALLSRVGPPPRSSRLPMAQLAGSEDDPLVCGS
jgi:nitrate reductase assembly molybdenum cofactor insertion protein NarJ